MEQIDQNRIDLALEAQLRSPNLSFLPTNSWLREVIEEIIKIADQTINDEIDFLSIAEELEIGDVLELIYNDVEKNQQIFREINEKIEAFCKNYFRTNKFETMVNKLTTDYDMTVIDRQMYFPVITARNNILGQMEGRNHWTIIFSRAIDQLMHKIFIEILNRIALRAIELEGKSDQSKILKLRFDAIIELISAHLEESQHVRGEKRSVYHDIVFQVLKSRQLELATSTISIDESKAEQREKKTEMHRKSILELAQSKRVNKAVYHFKEFSVLIEPISEKEQDDIIDTSRLCFVSIKFNLNQLKDFKGTMKYMLISSLAMLMNCNEESGYNSKEIENLSKILSSKLETLPEAITSVKDLNKVGIEFFYNAVSGQLEYPSIACNIKDLGTMSEKTYNFILHKVSLLINKNLRDSDNLIETPQNKRSQVQERVSTILSEDLSITQLRKSQRVEEEFARILTESDSTVISILEEPTDLSEEDSTEVQIDENIENDIGSDTTPQEIQFKTGLSIKIPRGVTASRMHSILQRIIGEPIRTTGKHVIYQRYNPTTNQYYGPICPVPSHGSSQPLGIGIIASILHSLDISKERFIDEI